MTIVAIMLMVESQTNMITDFNRAWHLFIEWLQFHIFKTIQIMHGCRISVEKYH